MGSKLNSFTSILSYISLLQKSSKFHFQSFYPADKSSNDNVIYPVFGAKAVSQ